MASNVNAAAPLSGHQTDNVSIRVIALAHATNENEDSVLVLNLDTTIAQLKEHLQQNLTQHPRPDAQRLIYQGRPLTDGSATLRQILRLEPANANLPSTHVLHLVIRDDQPAGTTNIARPQPTQTQPPPTDTTPNASHEPPQMQPGFGFAQQAFPPGHPAQAMLQNALQQHMAIHNQHRNQHLPNARQGFLPLPGAQLPHLPGMQNGPTPMGQGNLRQPNVSPLPTTNPAFNTAASNGVGLNHPPNVFQSGMTMRVHETIGPNGERIRRVVQNGLPLPGQGNPVERSASAPGIAPRSATPTSTLRPAGVPSAFPPVLQQFPHPQPPQFASLQPPFRLPSMQTGAVPFPAQQPPRNPMVYLVSSSGGPEALLFAPNHGYFSSQTSSSVTQATQQAPIQGADSQNQPHQSTTTQPTQSSPGQTRQNDQGQVALRPNAPGQVPAQVAAQAQAQQGRREGEDLVALVLQRGWLFLRLYMFIFVLSEPGTWRRYILLTLASLVCLLPRNNPFTDMFQAARRHFDNLIGPPQPPARPQVQQPQNPQATGTQGVDAAADNVRNTEPSSNTNMVNNQMPTPEEHARRLLREHEERNPNLMRDTIYRIEQAVALFLASLIPGVGERHVRAREEARRVVQEEEERRRRDEEERAQQHEEQTENKTDAAPVISTASISEEDPSAAVSTGVDIATPSGAANTSTTDEGIRLRSSDADV